jgi:hypothetical protein
MIQLIFDGRGRMLTETEAREFAEDWIRAWNSHDLQAILSHYASEVTLTSPVAAKLLNSPLGTVVGKEELRRYFTLGLKAFPDLAFELLEVTNGVSSLVLYYKNQSGRRTCEFMELNADGKVVRVVAHYSL